ncbi:hypothetical protein LTR78_000357 [Recurvomyces mirabilis]|uniref:Uncharacterized protein n=1 Tax=Recurvomyces mirabilis TaxID=574656 RepID=A0AAE0WX28_9PEZI|nr:hypothetical protein LTR78_000357 [Recurvomyces mirabilis]KAK5162012.1 hypothetical protein LTS14_000358 [Recurvomyces mirabilis]
MASKTKKDALKAVNKLLNEEIFNSLELGTRKVQVECATKTEQWIRPTRIPRTSEQDRLVEVVQQNRDRFPPATAKIVLNLLQHTSPKDSRPHWTVWPFDIKGMAFPTMHLYWVDEDLEFPDNTQLQSEDGSDRA